MQTIDLSNLHEITGGDREFENELYNEFIMSSSDMVNRLKACSENESHDNEEWRKTSHALKGISIQLGAVNLAELSKNAQDQFQDNLSAKKELYSQIHKEHKIVLDFLRQKIAENS